MEGFPVNLPNDPPVLGGPGVVGVSGFDPVGGESAQFDDVGVGGFAASSVVPNGYPILSPSFARTIAIEGNWTRLLTLTGG